MLRFGTDGVRGDADNDLTSTLVVALARAVARVLHPPRVVIGRDTRVSGPRIEADLAAGLRAEGVESVSLGVLPTPAIAFVAASQGVPAAIVPASHNRWSDHLEAEGVRKSSLGIREYVLWIIKLTHVGFSPRTKLRKLFGAADLDRSG